MNFPSFGDAAAYAELGERCASALTSSAGNLFGSCYDPLRPIGIVGFYTLPYLVTDDPVNRVFILLMTNILLFAGIFLALRTVLLSDSTLCADDREKRAILVGVSVFIPLLLFLIPHLPVTLSDLPSFAFFVFALWESSKILFRDNSKGQATRRYLLTGLLVSAAALLKQNYLVFGFFLIFSVLLFDRRSPSASPCRIRYLFVFLLGMSPVLIQFLNVYLHSGHFWFYETDYANKFFGHVSKKPNIEAIIFTIPTPSAFMLKVTNEISYFSFIVLKLYKGLFGFEWAVYHGKPAIATQFWTLSSYDFSKAYGLVFFYFAFTLFHTLRGAISFRLLNLNALLIALFTAFTSHTELRYYLLPRVVFLMMILYWLTYPLFRYDST